MLRSLQSSPGFFSVGLIMATFSDDGTVPVVREDFIMEVIGVIITGRHTLTSEVGMGSKRHVEEFDLVMSSECTPQLES